MSSQAADKHVQAAGEGEDLYMRLKCAQRQAEMLDIQVRVRPWM
jgi:hypothetical protein